MTYEDIVKLVDERLARPDKPFAVCKLDSRKFYHHRLSERYTALGYTVTCTYIYDVVTVTIRKVQS
jgi:hypothetical protein